MTQFFQKYNLISKGLNILALLATELWLIKSIKLGPPISVGWDSVAAFLAFLATLTWLEIKGTEKTDKERRDDADRRLFLQFLQVLPSDSLIIKFLRIDFTGISYPIDLISIAEMFADNWSVEEKTFHNPELEQSKVRLVSLFCELLEYSADHMRLINSQITQIYYKHEDPRFKEAEERMIFLVSEIINTHQELIRRARDKLHI